MKSKIQQQLLLLAILLLTTLSNNLQAQVSGIVYKDYNASGVRDNTVGTFVEPLVQGVTVKAYSAADVLLATTSSNASGAYSFTGLTLPIRIEFSGLPASYLPGCATNQTSISGSNVQFITSSTTTADFRINNPDNFSQPNPMVLDARMFTGPAATNTNKTLQGIYYNTNQFTVPTFGTNIFGFAGNDITGTTWGLAYSRRSKTVFQAAVVRNYMGTIGTDGFDKIYTHTFSDPLDDAGATATMTQSTTIDLSTLGVTVGTDPRSTGNITGTSPYTDNSLVYQNVGKIGIGDIDISSDGDTLFVINMNQAAPSLAIINVSNPASPVLISDVALNMTPCTQGTFRPWAVKYFEGQVYIGGVCDAATGSAANLQASVYRYDGGTSFTQVASMPLNYLRGYTTFRASTGAVTSANWLPWTNTWAPQTLTLSPSDIASQPQPMLTDIEFLDDGSMVLGFSDRFAFQNANLQHRYDQTSGATYTTPSGGDIIKFCNIGGVLTMETATGGCLQNNTDVGSIAPSNPIGSGIKEYFDDDYYNTGSSTGDAGHSETSLGALAVLAGRQQILATSFDAVSTTANGGTSGPVNTSGIRKYTNAGANVAGGSTATTILGGWVTVPQVTGGGSSIVSNFKGGNLGDIELLCNAAPIEIGNRIWNDANANGIQDPGEAIFTNVTVELFLDANSDGIPDGAALATVTTDANGQYIFSNQVTTEYTGADPGTGHAKFNITQLVSKQNYIVRIGAADWNSTTGEGAGDLANLHLTTANATGNGMTDWSDNDATLFTDGANKYAQIKVTTGILGANDHTEDFGFKNTISLCGVVWNDVNGNATTVGTPDGSEAVVNGTNAGVGITTGTVLYANLIDGGNVIATTPIGADGSYCFPIVPQKTTGLTVQLTTNQGVVGQPKPATVVPTGWITTGENKNTQGGTADATPDSEIPVTTAIIDITIQNFGIQQVPESAVHTENLAINPGGTICSTVDPIWFETSNVGVNPNTQDYNGGSVVSIRFTAFPTNATSITINGTTFLSTDPAWPANGGPGITILYTQGVGPATTICLDPIDGAITAVIPFASKDNAGKEDPTPGSVSVVYLTTLPVSLISFTAVNENASVNLNWKVATQQNVVIYEIQRSANGVDFATIGNTSINNSLQYLFVDNNPLTGNNYYKLKVIDNNGSFKFTNILKVNRGKQQLQVYPTITKNTITIAGLKTNTVIQVLSTEGKLIDALKVTANVITYNTTGLAKGMYILKQADGDTVETVKFIKE
jgi:hypothetical protein